MNKLSQIIVALALSSIGATAYSENLPKILTARPFSPNCNANDAFVITYSTHESINTFLGTRDYKHSKSVNRLSRGDFTIVDTLSSEYFSSEAGNGGALNVTLNGTLRHDEGKTSSVKETIEVSSKGYRLIERIINSKKTHANGINLENNTETPIIPTCAPNTVVGQAVARDQRAADELLEKLGLGKSYNQQQRAEIERQEREYAAFCQRYGAYFLRSKSECASANDFRRCMAIKLDIYKLDDHYNKLEYCTR